MHLITKKSCEQRPQALSRDRARAQACCGRARADRARATACRARVRRQHQRRGAHLRAFDTLERAYEGVPRGFGIWNGAFYRFQGVHEMTRGIWECLVCCSTCF